MPDRIGNEEAGCILEVYITDYQKLAPFLNTAETWGIWIDSNVITSPVRCIKCQAALWHTRDLKGYETKPIPGDLAIAATAYHIMTHHKEQR